MRTFLILIASNLSVILFNNDFAPSTRSLNFSLASSVNSPDFAFAIISSVLAAALSHNSSALSSILSHVSPALSLILSQVSPVLSAALVAAAPAVAATAAAASLALSQLYQLHRWYHHATSDTVLAALSFNFSAVSLIFINSAFRLLDGCVLSPSID
jgi:hypothetical protein